MMAPLLGDQVDVLDDNDRRLQRPGHRARGGDHPQRAAGQQHGGDARQPAEQVPQRMGLARARNAVEQYPAPQMLAAGQQSRRVPGNAKHLPLDPVEYLWRQDHLVPGDLRTVDETQQRAAVVIEYLVSEGDDVAAEDVML